MNVVIMGGILTILILLLGCQLICSSVQRTKENSVITMINTKWNLSPFVLEVVEFFAEENNHLFWTYVDIINSLDPSLSELGLYKFTVLCNINPYCSIKKLVDRVFFFLIR